MLRHSLLTAGAALLFAGFNSASADTATTGSPGTENMTVSIVVADSCEFTVEDNVDFGTQGPVNDLTANTPGTVDVQCTAGTEYSLSISDVDSEFEMTNGDGGSIPYTLDIAENASGVTADGDVETFTVNGTLDITQQPPAGSYSDTVTITLTIDATQI